MSEEIKLTPKFIELSSPPSENGFISFEEAVRISLIPEVSNATRYSDSDLHSLWASCFAIGFVAGILFILVVTSHNI